MKKQLSRIVCALFAVIMIFSMGVYVYADSSTDNLTTMEQLINNKNESYSSYMPQIKAIMTDIINEKELYDTGTSKYLYGEPDIISSYNLDGAYRVNILEPLLLTTYEKKKSFKDAITDTIQWKVPITTEKGESGLVVLLEEDGKLSYIGMSVGQATQTWLINDNILKETAKKSQEFQGKIESMQLVHSYLYNTTFIYLAGEQTDYLIPYSTYSKEIGIDNGRIYKSSEVLNKFIDCFDEKVLIDNPSYNGGAPFREHTFSPMAIVVVLIAVLLGLVIVSLSIMFYNYKKKKQTHF